jgi:cytochrome c-type biogenesis protein CcmH
MMTFWIICTLILIIALAFVVWPLWFAKNKDNTVLQDAANLEIIRDQLNELDNDLANGLLTQELHEQGKRELQSKLLEEVKDPQAVSKASARNPIKVLTVVLVVLIPLVSFGLYFKIGDRNALLPQSGHSMAEGFGEVRSEPALRALEEKVAQSPDDPNALVVLARSYANMERFSDAARVYEQLTKIVPNEVELWADYADVLAMVHGQKFAGGPTRMIEKALLLDPNHPKSLALAGSAAMERGDYQAAINYWQSLLNQLPAESDDAKMIASGISQAHEFLAQMKGNKGMSGMRTAPIQEPAMNTAPAGKERLTGTVTLNADLKGKADPEDTLFVLARAAQGPKMPLAILRKQVKDLPLKFSLDDSMAMSPQMKLSDFPKVVVVARISKSGTAMPQSGDLQGISGELSPGTKSIAIHIDQLVQ